MRIILNLLARICLTLGKNLTQEYVKKPLYFHKAAFLNAIKTNLLAVSYFTGSTLVASAFAASTFGSDLMTGNPLSKFIACVN